MKFCIFLITSLYFGGVVSVYAQGFDKGFGLHDW